MGKEQNIPGHIIEELARHGLPILEHYKCNNGHYCVTFPSPTGKGTCKFHWPHAGGKADPRAMLNNKAEFKKYLRRLQALPKS